MEKSFIITLLLCFLGGNLGLHRFYTGHTKLGILYLLTGGLFGLGTFHDIYKLAQGDYEDANEENLDGWNPQLAWFLLIILYTIYITIILYRFSTLK